MAAMATTMLLQVRPNPALAITSMSSSGGGGGGGSGGSGSGGGGGGSLGWVMDRASTLLNKMGSKIVEGGSGVLARNNMIKGLWDVCDACGAMLYARSDDDTGIPNRICHECGYHLRRGSSDRIDLLLDPGTWAPLDETMVAKDVLGFRDDEDYATRLVSYRKRSGLTDAVQTGLGEIMGTKIALGVMDFRFMGGSMGSVVGEKITRLVEHATRLELPLVIVCSSGGARMQEGTLSLMQMAKVSAALDVHQIQKGLLYIPILTNPTTGGITASFGMLGDIAMAEPMAYIAFAGGRVIQQTLRKKLPENFQTAEYCFEHGLVDLIVPGSLLRSALSDIFDLYAAAPIKRKASSGGFAPC
ncbi:uncharacterized protein LOC9662509 [Selaginella moellendorffii]|nr:uncharacterized protein LOC9662509 [Selaginella moellendorffii]|eukprot:XP_002962190.2 uncharacterized protein LOC9662509 [Selaginella moellendorffii]